MSLDLSQFYQVFFEETAEHLGAMESLLLNLDVGAPSMEDLNAIFRAAHSIKGGSGTFGFTDMTEVTHVLETLLDRLRKQEMTLTDDMVNAFLRAGDVLAMQLAAHRGEGEVDAAEVRSVCEELNALAVGGASSAPPAPVVAVTGKQEEADYGFFGDEPVVSASDAGYGFFTDDAQPPQPDPGYGFFDAVPTPAAAADPGYGFFDDLPAPVSSEGKAVEADAGFGFFEDAPGSVAVIEDARGYGFFRETPSQRSVRENKQGYGIYEEHEKADEGQPAAAVPAASPGRRATDDPQADGVRAGKRATDRVVAAPTDTSIRVSVEKVDQLINLMGELVITQAMLNQAATHTDGVMQERLEHGLRQLERNTRDLQEAVMSIRMLPISFVFSRFPRVVRDLAGKLGKQIELKTLGESTELDKGLIEKIADPLTHLIRNSLDHGIELPEKRVAAGKNPKGTVTLNAFHQGGSIVIEVSDDGGGLNRGKILGKAKERGLPVSDDMPDADVWMLIFEAGFSTADVVTDVSGRGVGMDVVKRNIAELGGRIELDSHEGSGTRTTIRLPLTLAILDGLSVSIGGEVYIAPLNAIIESLQVSETDLKTVGRDGRLLKVRGEYLPLLPLHEVFNIAPKARELEQGIVIIVENEGRKTALFVDELLGQQQVVIKSLESNFRKVHGISGATIMGDGRVALILDVNALGAMVAQHQAIAG
ncbi:chemotaxis protein CheW [Ferriphaselus sp. R-1]|uniref:chemotaxis protein CheW n=1 Tax=Ferriphaselus sp. R-1 TaxID=1485544 RepID=UPI000557A7A8|nr:chemotaxis protein CheW [Ferriphaselus sp. R-1]